MTVTERQDAIVAKLRAERFVKISSLVSELGCNERTVRRDIEKLSASGFPLETVRGRYGGGVQLLDWYHPQRSTLCPEQLWLLKKVATLISPADQKILNSIIDQFGPRR